MSHYDKRHINKIVRDASIIKALEVELRNFDNAAKGTITKPKPQKKVTETY